MKIEDKLKETFAPKVSYSPDNKDPVEEKPLDLHSSVQTNKQTEDQLNKSLLTQTNTRLNLYLSVYMFKATKIQINKGTFKPSNIEISDEMRTAMDKLINIYLDGVVANDTDRTYKDIVNNALFEYLTKKFNQLQNAN